MIKPLLAILPLFLVACDDWGASSDNLTNTKARDRLEIKGLAVAKPVKEVLAALGVKDDEFASYATWDEFGGYPECRAIVKNYTIPEERLMGFTVLQRQIGPVFLKVLPDIDEVAQVTLWLPICDEERDLDFTGVDEAREVLAQRREQFKAGADAVSQSCEEANEAFVAALSQKFGRYEFDKLLGYRWQNKTSVLVGVPSSGHEPAKIHLLSQKAIAGNLGFSEWGGLFFSVDGIDANREKRPTCEAIMKSKKAATDL